MNRLNEGERKFEMNQTGIQTSQFSALFEGKTINALTFYATFRVAHDADTHQIRHALK